MRNCGRYQKKRNLRKLTGLIEWRKTGFFLRKLIVECVVIVLVSPDSMSVSWALEICSLWTWFTFTGESGFFRLGPDVECRSQFQNRLKTDLFPPLLQGKERGELCRRRETSFSASRGAQRIFPFSRWRSPRQTRTKKKTGICNRNGLPLSLFHECRGRS